MVRPLAGAVHRYQIEACGGWPPWNCSKISVVAPRSVRPLIELLGPGRNCADAKLSLNGAANAGVASANAPPMAAVARVPATTILRRVVDMVCSRCSGG